MLALLTFRQGSECLHLTLTPSCHSTLCAYSSFPTFANFPRLLYPSFFFLECFLNLFPTDENILISFLSFLSFRRTKINFLLTYKNKFPFVSKISLPSEQRVCLFCVALWFSFIFSVIIFQALLIVCALFIYTVTAETEEGQSGRSRVSDEQLNMALSDQRYLRRQLKCALGEAPCDPVGRRLKSKYYVYSARTN